MFIFRSTTINFLFIQSVDALPHIDSFLTKQPTPSFPRSHVMPAKEISASTPCFCNRSLKKIGRKLLLSYCAAMETPQIAPQSRRNPSCPPSCHDSPSLHRIVFRSNVGILLSAIISAFLASLSIYSMMSPATTERPVTEQCLDGKPEPNRRHT